MEYSEVWHQEGPVVPLIGQLQHACCVVKPGRSFLRQMTELSSSVRELHHRVRLNAGFRSNLKWWACFLPIWNGSCPVSSISLSKPSVELTSDASGSWGCGAYTSQGHWFQLPLPERSILLSRSCCLLFWVWLCGARGGKV